MAVGETTLTRRDGRRGDVACAAMIGIGCRCGSIVSRTRARFSGTAFGRVASVPPPRLSRGVPGRSHGPRGARSADINKIVALGRGAGACGTAACGRDGRSVGRMPRPTAPYRLSSIVRVSSRIPGEIALRSLRKFLNSHEHQHATPLTSADRLAPYGAPFVHPDPPPARVLRRSFRSSSL